MIKMVQLDANCKLQEYKISDWKISPKSEQDEAIIISTQR